MRQIPIVFLCVAFFPSARDIIAQEGFIWTDSVVEYRFSSLSDSLPQHKVTNYVREEDSATHLHITASWDTELNAWINEYKSIGISNQVARKLELQTYYWDDNNTWAGSSRSFFWYDSKEDIMYKVLFLLNLFLQSGPLHFFQHDFLCKFQYLFLQNQSRTVPFYIPYLNNFLFQGEPHYNLMQLVCGL